MILLPLRILYIFLLVLATPLQFYIGARRSDSLEDLWVEVQFIGEKWRLAFTRPL